MKMETLGIIAGIVMMILAIWIEDAPPHGGAGALFLAGAFVFWVNCPASPKIDSK